MERFLRAVFALVEMLKNELDGQLDGKLDGRQMFAIFILQPSWTVILCLFFCPFL